MRGSASYVNGVPKKDSSDGWQQRLSFNAISGPPAGFNRRRTVSLLSRWYMLK